MSTIQARRRLIVVILLCLSVAGAVLRQWAAPGSVARDVGTLLMLLWLPVIGTVVAWSYRKITRRPQPAVQEPPAFGAAFTAHARVELTLRAPQLPSHNTLLPAGEYRCALVLGQEGFSARWLVPEGEALARGVPHALQVEFLTPSVAGPRFPSGTVFRVLADDSFIADGRVLKVLADA